MRHAVTLPSIVAFLTMLVAVSTTTPGRAQDDIVLESALAARNVEYWLAALLDAGVPCGPIQDVAQVLADPQVAARNMIVEAEDPVAGTIRMPGSPIKLGDRDEDATRPPAPELDGDRAAILEELD